MFKVVLNLNSKLKDDVVEVFCEKAIGINVKGAGKCLKRLEQIKNYVNDVKMS